MYKRLLEFIGFAAATGHYEKPVSRFKCTGQQLQNLFVYLTMEIPYRLTIRILSCGLRRDLIFGMTSAEGYSKLGRSVMFLAMCSLSFI
jgi:hypothetical protein